MCTQFLKLAPEIKGVTLELSKLNKVRLLIFIANSNINDNTLEEAGNNLSGNKELEHIYLSLGNLYC